MKELKTLLGQKIKELRNQRGYSQQQLAEMINIDQRNLSNIECGNTFPTKTLLKIAESLDVPIQELFNYNYLTLSQNDMKKYIIKKLNTLNKEKITILYRLLNII